MFNRREQEHSEEEDKSPSSAIAGQWRQLMGELQD